MNYEVVYLEPKNVIGFTARTNNTSPEMSTVIGGCWQKLYNPINFTKVKNRANEKALGVYTEYENKELGNYTIMTGFEVTNSDRVEGFDTITIPAGKYAKFIVKGNMITAVQEFWQRLWQMNLNRAYRYDFEEYQNADSENAEIHIYISIQ